MRMTLDAKKRQHYYYSCDSIWSILQKTVLLEFLIIHNIKHHLIQEVHS